MKKLFFCVFIAIFSVFLLSCSKGDKKIVSKYSDGTPQLVDYYKGGKRVFQERYYSDGKLRSKGPYADSVRTGEWKFFFDNGKIFAKADFSDKREGRMWQVYKESGEQLIDKTDKIISMSFSPEETLVDVTLQRGGKEVFYRFFESFRLMVEQNLVGNVPQGRSLTWYENGKLNSEAYYRDGFEDSVHITYAETGQKMMIGHYKNGVKVGKWEFFNSEGKPMGTEIYDSDGKILKENENSGLILIRHSDKEDK
ncbi:MAG: hypothetical protein IJ748_03435 [Bacteroidales bacterium]|nr:hypothetical protein [Bacteroidales bacterium]